MASNSEGAPEAGPTRVVAPSSTDVVAPEPPPGLLLQLGRVVVRTRELGEPSATSSISWSRQGPRDMGG